MKETTEPAIRFDSESGKFMGELPSVFIRAWAVNYPGINLQQEMDRAALWLLVNPRRRPKNCVRYLNNWFKRAQRDCECRGKRRVA